MTKPSHLGARVHTYTFDAFDAFDGLPRCQKSSQGVEGVMNREIYARGDTFAIGPESDSDTFAKQR